MEFNQAIGFVFGEEGGYANNKSDRGGMTNFGISQKAYPNVDIKNLSKEQAQSIYKRDYWDAMNLDNQPESLRLVALDTAVNHGVGAAKRMLNQAGGDPAKVIELRKGLYQSIVQNDPTQQVFEKGWSNRLGRLGATLVMTADPQAPVRTAPDAATTMGQVAGWFEKGLGNSYILQKLGESGYADKIKQGRADGFTDDEIVAGFGGNSLAQVKQARAQIDKMGVFDVAGAKARDMVAGGGLALRQMAATDGTPEAERLLAEKRARDADPTRRAINDTATGTAVGLLPAIGATAAGIATAPVTGPIAGAALIAGTAAAEQALTPQDSNEERLKNVAIGAGTGVVAGAAGSLAARGIARGVQGVRSGGAMPKSLTDRIVGTTQQDIKGAMSNEAREALANENNEFLAKQIIKRTGATQAKAVDETLLRELEGNAYKTSNDLLSKMMVAADSTAADEIQAIGKKYSRNVLKVDNDKKVGNYAGDIAKRIQAGNVTGKEILEWQRSIQRNAVEASGSTREALNQIRGKLDDLIEQYDPKAKAALIEDNKLYRKQLVVDRLIKNTNNTGEITPAKLNQAIKATSGKSYSKGQAPLQDLYNEAKRADAQDMTKGRWVGALNSDKLETGGAFGLLVNPLQAVPSYLAAKAAKSLLNRAARKRVLTLEDLIEGKSEVGKQSANSATNAYIARAIGRATGTAAASE